jgi:MAE_28990/MAE_18760-like HEPN
MLFSFLTSRLRSEIDIIQKTLSMADGLRTLLTAHHKLLSATQGKVPPGADPLNDVAHGLASLLTEAPDKLDWQVYDHCAALTRLYAVFEQYVGELVDEYVRLLPQFYAKYADLPESIRNQHRVGIGTILLKIGDKGPYKDLEEQVVVRELAAGLSGATEYKLLSNAFFIERQNLRFDVLCKLFRSLDFEDCATFIKEHSTVTQFITNERAGNSSVEKELGDFIDYRNEAAHRQVENVLAPEEVGAIGRFLLALGDALADMVDERVLRYRMNLEQYMIVLGITEIHPNGYVVIGTPDVGVKLAVGDEVIVFGTRTCARANLESMRILDSDVPETIGDGTMEIGLRLSRPVPTPAELRKIVLPAATPEEIQLELEDMIPAMADAAETDLPETVEAESIEESGEIDE